jgi:hypothetical protein
MMDFNEWEMLIKRYLQINQCVVCRNNTSDTHWLSEVCKKCVNKCMTIVKEREGTHE